MMDLLLDRKHIGIILVIIGTFFMGWSVKTKQSYDKGLRNSIRDENRQRRKNGIDDDVIMVTETWIDRKQFYGGLVLVAAGSLLQW
jgi:hypothetical protein